LPFALPQREAFPQRRFVDLDNRRAGLLEVHNLITDCKGDLAAGNAAGLIVANERPVQDRHRAG
jgi:hypothetical protein